MKPVYELAEELNVPVKTIYRKVNKLRRNTGQSVTVKLDETIFITPEGESFIKERLSEARETTYSSFQQEDKIHFLEEKISLLEQELYAEQQRNHEQSETFKNLTNQINELKQQAPAVLSANTIPWVFTERRKI